MKTQINKITAAIYNPLTISIAIGGAVGFASSMIFKYSAYFLQSIYFANHKAIYTLDSQPPSLGTILYYIALFIINAIPYFIAGLMSMWLHNKLKINFYPKSE